jgi:precorrin-2/cobalt-factor-2 C20-methyltransferase
MFFGIGVGPGAAGLIPVAAVKALQQSDVILVPRASRASKSVAQQCISDLGLPENKFREVVFTMDSDRAQALRVYDEMAAQIISYLNNGQNVAYLTIGDSMTFSTYGYLLTALLRLSPDLQHKTFPGITSYAAIASAVGWTLGQSKERVLILPCPDTEEELQAEIESHDIIVLMKIGDRMPLVHSVVSANPQYECAIAQKIGLPDEHISTNLSEFIDHGGGGYLTTILIRHKAEEQA